MLVLFHFLMGDDMDKKIEGDDAPMAGLDGPGGDVGA